MLFDLKLTIHSTGLPTAFRYLLGQDCPLLFVIIICALPLQNIIAPQTAQQDEHGTESSRTTGASSNTQPVATRLQLRHQLAQRKTSYTATGTMNLDEQFEIVCETGRSKNKKQHANRCESSRIDVDTRQLLVS